MPASYSVKSRWYNVATLEWLTQQTASLQTVKENHMTELCSPEAQVSNHMNRVLDPQRDCPKVELHMSTPPPQLQRSARTENAKEMPNTVVWGILGAYTARIAVRPS